MATKALHLNKVAGYNDIPEKFIPELPPVGKTVIFQLKDKSYDPIAGTGGTPKSFYPNDLQFSPLSRFRNPDTGEWIKIGMITREDERKNPVCEGAEREMCAWRPSASNGFFLITIGSNPIGDAMCQYLMLSSQVESNNLEDDMRDKEVVPIVKMIDEHKEALKLAEQQRTRWEAMSKVFTMTDEQLKDIAYMLGSDVNSNIDILKANVRQYAETNPAEFLLKVQDTDGTFKSRIMEALKLEIVIKDEKNLVLRMNDKTKSKLLAISDLDDETIQTEYAIACRDEKFLKNFDAHIATAILAKK